MKITILGGGPAGLYSGLLIKKANPEHEIVIVERNAADVTYGWGVVFSDRTLTSFQRADYKSYEQIANQFVIWDSIDVYFRGERLHCGGHVIAGISRKALLNILQKRCLELGISLQFSCEVNDLAELPAYDLLIAADGINSIVRRTYAHYFKSAIEVGKAKYIWLGADKALDAFTFIFRENEHGLFQVHAYPFSGTASTFLLECDEASWLNAGLDKAGEAESLVYCQRLLVENLDGASLLSNNSKWISFSTLKTRLWHYKNIVLLGDCAHTAHFSIGSGTKLAMEDAIAIAHSLEQHQDLETALGAYELERKPIVEVFQKAAAESQTYFEAIKRYLGLDPVQFAFQLLTRSGRVTYDDLKFRDVRFGETVDRWYMRKTGDSKAIVAPPPMFAPMRLRGLTIPTRIVLLQRARAGMSSPGNNCEGCPGVVQEPLGNVGLVLTELTAVSAEGRITPESPGIYNAEQGAAWRRIVEHVHSISHAKIALQLGHSGRRGSTRPRSEGLDRPLRMGNWQLVSASPIPYTQRSQVPREMDRAAMDQVRDEFVRATWMAEEAGFDQLHLHFAHGYLLASFLSPLTNLREDEYGGDLEQRMRFPLQVFDAVRTAWPQDKPVSVALSATDCVKGGFSIGDAVAVARVLKVHGCDMLEVLAGQTTIDGEPTYGRGFLTALSDCLRNEAGVPVIVGGYLTTSDEINTILAAGRADLCIMEITHVDT